MNFSFFVTLTKQNFSNTWKWLPHISRRGWPFKNGGKVWYFHFDWLCFSAQWDNEW